VVILSQVLPANSTVGYDDLAYLTVKKVPFAEFDYRKRLSKLRSMIPFDRRIIQRWATLPFFGIPIETSALLLLCSFRFFNPCIRTDGNTFQVSYEGGTGNDLTLTVQ
jgi:hypothetical protein